MYLVDQEVESALRHLWQPYQHRLLLYLRSAQVLGEVTERAADDDVGRGVVSVVIVQMKVFLPPRGLLTAEPASVGGGARLPPAPPRVGRPGRRDGRKEAGEGGPWVQVPQLPPKVTTPEVPVIEALPPDAVLAALLIQAPPLTSRPQSTRPATPMPTRPPSRFCG